MWLLGWCPPPPQRLLSRGVAAIRQSECRVRVTPQDLHLAVISRDVTRVKCLLRVGVDAGVAVSGATPLSLALYRQDNDIVRVLLDHRRSDRSSFDLDILSRDHVRRLEPPLITACRLNNVEAVELLVEDGANMETVDHNGRTALHMAVYQRSRDLAEFLIEKGVCVNPSTNYSRSPLFASLARLEMHHSIAELLILSGASVHVDIVDIGRPSSLLSYLLTRILNSSSSRSIPYVKIIQLIIVAGYNVSADECVRSLWQKKESIHDSDIYDLIEREMNHPSSLQRQCLRVIRKSVAVRCRSCFFRKSLRKLPLPKSLLEMVALGDGRR